MTNPLKSSRIGLLAGVFDPIHIGHLHMAYIAMEEAALTQVWFVLTHVPPHKKPPMATYEHRLNMLRLALASEPKFRLAELEPDPTPTYTYQTLKRVRSAISGKPYFILGGDEWNQLHTWKEYDVLIDNAIYVVIPRREPLVDRPEVQVVIAPSTPIDLSSTYIRERLVRGKSIRHLVPTEVEAYITSNKLYEQGGA